LRKNGRDIDFEAVKDYFRELNGDPRYTAGSKRIKRQAVKKRIRLLFEGADIETQVKLDRTLKELDRAGETKAPSVNTKEIHSDKVITETEYERLIESARSDRQRGFIKFLWATGCRISEALNCRLIDCKEDRETVSIRIIGKGNKERHIRITAELYRELKKIFQGETFLFETGSGKTYSRSYVSNQIKKLGRAVLNREISAHTLRHSFATRLIQKTKKIKAVSVYLGHASTAITLNMYTHETLDDAELFT
jgi:integrase/recombinase XerD